MCLWGNKCFGCVLDDPGTPSELRERLINKITLVLNSGSDEECAICLDSLRQPVITYCAHVYCRPCICEVIRSEKVSIVSVSQSFPEESWYVLSFLDIICSCLTGAGQMSPVSCSDQDQRAGGVSWRRNAGWSSHWGELAIKFQSKFNIYRYYACYFFHHVTVTGGTLMLQTFVAEDFYLK